MSDSFQEENTGLVYLTQKEVTVVFKTLISQIVTSLNIGIRAGVLIKDISVAKEMDKM